MIQVAVIDLAGTLVRDDGAVEGAFLDALRAVGRVGDGPAQAALLDAVQQAMGRSKIVVFRELLGDETLAQRANDAFEAAYAGRIEAGEPTALPPAERALLTLRDNGVRIAVTTGFSPATRDALLEQLGWVELVDAALSPSERLRGRPAPDLVLQAALELRADDVRAVAVAGDTVNDLLCGHRAGAGIVAGVLGGAHPRDALDSTPHTHIVEDVGEFADVVLASGVALATGPAS
jgi:phosphonatase-like hydrolase